MIEVVAAVIVRNGRYLVALRPAEKHHGGLWEFPGGKRLAEESLTEAIRRELVEELGIHDANVGRLLTTLEADGIRLRFLEIRTDLDPRPTEHPELRWCTPDELRGMPLCPLDGRFAASL